MEELLRILIIIIGIIGLLLVSTNSFKRKPGLTFFFYFTNLSNIFIVIYYLFNINNKAVHFMVTLYILFTMIIFNFVIIPHLKLEKSSLKDIGTNALASTFVHILVPTLSVLYWFKYSNNVELSIIPVTYIFPIFYSLFCIVLGKSGYQLKENITNYVYPFLDIEKNGKIRVAINLIILLIFFSILGYALIKLR